MPRAAQPARTIILLPALAVFQPIQFLPHSVVLVMGAAIQRDPLCAVLLLAGLELVQNRAVRRQFLPLTLLSAGDNLNLFGDNIQLRAQRIQIIPQVRAVVIVGLFFDA